MYYASDFLVNQPKMLKNHNFKKSEKENTI